MTIIAIDFGTSNTVVSFIEPDTKLPKNIRFPEISRLLKFGYKDTGITEIAVVPTLAFIKNSQEMLIGEKVRSQRLGIAQPQRFFKAFKRDLVAEFKAPPRQIDGNSYSAELIAELFLKQIWQRLQQQYIKPSGLVLTVPVGAFERYLNWFRQLCNNFGIEDVRLVDESTAAALGYAIKRPGSIVLVVDFGGGTLDLSVVRTNPILTANSQKEYTLQAEVIAKSDVYVGGDDIDTWIVENYLYAQNLSKEKVGRVGWQNLLEIAERLKIRLSGEEVAKESWLDEESFMSYELLLTRNELDEILENRQLLEQLRGALDEVLAIASRKGISKGEIEQVLLVGGSCLIPSVQKLIISYFGRQKVKLDKPFDAVCHGALALTQIADIEDYLHHSYAIRVWEPLTKGYSYFALFDKGIKYPCTREEPLMLQVAIEGQKEIRLDIGEVAEISQAEVIFDESGRMSSTQLLQQKAYRSLESHDQKICVAHLKPPGEVGIDRITVQFEVDEKRILLATVRDLLTGKLLVEKAAIAKLK
jgi:molecular chaperone DnaK (HSP70)